MHTITVPSPTGTGNATATINYKTDGTCTVSSLVDANGNSRNYSATDANHTLVTVKDPLNAVVYSNTAGFDGNMSGTTKTNGANVIQGTKTFASPNTPYEPSSVTDALGHSWSYTWDSYGNCLTSTTPRNTTTTNTYNYTNFALGRLTQVQQGSKTATVITYFEPSGLLSTDNMPAPGTVNGGTVAKSYSYDALGNGLSITEPGNNASATIFTTYNFTTDGSYSQTAAIGQPLKMTDNLGKSTHYRYDSRGNKIQYTDALGNTTNIVYNIADQILSVTNPATGQSGTGNSFETKTYLYPGGPLLTANTYDESGTLVRQFVYNYGLEGEQVSVTGNSEPVGNSYDALYRGKTLTDANGNVTRYYYKQAGYLDAITYPGYAGPSPVYNSATDSYSNISGKDSLRLMSYDSLGHLTQQIDGRGVVTNRVFNTVENDLSDIQYPASTVNNIHYNFDAYGRMSGMTDSTGSVGYSHDDNDQRLSETVTYTGLPSKTLTHTFYPDGSDQSLVTPSGTFSYNYDAVGRCSSITNPYFETSSWTYLDNDWLSSESLSNGVLTNYTRNAKGQITAQTSLNSMGATVLQFSGVQYDGRDNPKSFTASHPAVANYSGTTNFTFDAKNQITQEQSTRLSGYTNNFAYDNAGNATSFRGVTNTYNTNNQDTAHTYDFNGNPTTYKGVSMSYDVENRLTASGTTMTAGYNGNDLRSWKQTSAGRTYFLFDGENPIIEMDSTGAVTAVNTHGANGLVSRHASTGSVFYTFDRQGNVAQRWSGGTLAASDVYEAFGTGVSTAVRTDPFGYGAKWGYYTDLETGLCLLTHRYYDPGTGRFLTRDPMSYGGGVNLYNFCWNNSMLNHDSSGLDPLHPGCTKAERDIISRAMREVCSKVSTMKIDPRLKDCLRKRCNSKFIIVCAKGATLIAKVIVHTRPDQEVSEITLTR